MAQQPPITQKLTKLCASFGGPKLICCIANGCRECDPPFPSGVTASQARRGYGVEISNDPKLSF